MELSSTGFHTASIFADYLYYFFLDKRISSVVYKFADDKMALIWMLEYYCESNILYKRLEKWQM